MILVRWLVSRLYPSHVDLHAYRVLLVAATGYTPEEITALTERDVEYLPTGVRLTLIKQRAQQVRHRTFGSEPSPGNDGQAVEFTDRPHQEVGAIIKHLTHVTAQARVQAPNAAGRLFVAASVTQAYELRIAPWAANKERSGFGDWLAAAKVTVAGAPDIRRLRKSTKVEKAIAFGGRIADAANDHHEEVFRGHYAQGTTLRVMSGRVITTAQDHWFAKAVQGPTVLTNSTEVLDGPEQAAALGLTRQQAEDIRRGALDMGLTQCSDPHNSPYGRPGELCPVAPLRCLECRNAWVLPSDLPQLLLFADHFDRLRLRLSPQHFASCGDRATPICTPSWPSAQTTRKPWPASTSRPVGPLCICRWPRMWSSTGEPSSTKRLAQCGLSSLTNRSSGPTHCWPVRGCRGLETRWNGISMGSIRRPANLPAAAWTVVFSDELAEPSWNLLAREVSMIMFNPRHPAVTAAGVSLKPAPANPATVIGKLSHLRRMASWAHANGLPPLLADWQEDDLRRLVEGLREQLSNNSIRNYIATLKCLHQCRPALTSRGLRSDPWTRKSARAAAHVGPRRCRVHSRDPAGAVVSADRRGLDLRPHLRPRHPESPAALSGVAQQSDEGLRRL